MPRITSVKIAPFNTVQSISDDAVIVITRDANDDLMAAVEADMSLDSDHVKCGYSDFENAWHEGLGYIAAGMLSGATECAHVDAVCWAHHFNARGVLRSGVTVEHAAPDARRGTVTRTPTTHDHPNGATGNRDSYMVAWHDGSRPTCHSRVYLRVVEFIDPRRDIYSHYQWDAWQAFHDEHGTTCPSCEAVNYRAFEVGGGREHATCANCLAKLDAGWPAAMDEKDFTDLIYGYVTSATWTDLEKPPVCPDCGEFLNNHYDSDAQIESWSCGHAFCDRTIVADSEVEDQRDSGRTRGSDPYEYGPEDLNADVLREVRSDCDGFVSGRFSDLRLISDQLGDGYDHANGHKYSAWEQIGALMYYDAAGHGTGFCDLSTPEYSEDERNVEYHGGLDALRALNVERKAWNDALSRCASYARTFSTQNLYLDVESGKIG